MINKQAREARAYRGILEVIKILRGSRLVYQRDKFGTLSYPDGIAVPALADTAFYAGAIMYPGGIGVPVLPDAEIFYGSFEWNGQSPIPTANAEYYCGTLAYPSGGAATGTT